MSASAPKSLLLLLTLGFLWGSGYTLARYATTKGVSPLGYAYWQTLGPACILWVITFLKGEYKTKRTHSLPFYALIGGLGIAIPNSTIYWLSSHMSAGLLAVCVNTVPLFTFLIALLLKEDRFNPWRLAAIILCLIGLFLLIEPSIASNSSLSSWVLLALIPPLCFALTAVIISKSATTHSSILRLSTGMLIAATCWLSPIIWKFNLFYWPQAGWHSQDYAILCEIILSSLGYVVFFQLLKTAGAVYYSLVSGVVALTGLGWGYLVFHNQFTIITWSAIGCIVIAIFGLSLVHAAPIKDRQ